MSSFTCEHCNTDILEGEDGEYLTGCPHYPIQVFKIGVFEIIDEGGEYIWISGEGGEGGQFSREKFAEVVSQFYSDNF